MNNQPVIIVIGAGLVGSLSMMLLQCCGFRVIAIEQLGQGGGLLSRTNHGRFHSGLWDRDIALVTKYHKARQLLKEMGLFIPHPPSLCVFPSSEEKSISSFLAESNLIHSYHEVVVETGKWFYHRNDLLFISVEAEGCFNPAGLASRARLAFERLGGVIQRQKVLRILSQPSEGYQYQILMQDGSSIVGDVIVNAAGAATRHLEKSLLREENKIVFRKWFFLCILNEYEPLRRVINLFHTRCPIGIIPHTNWVVIGADHSPVFDEKPGTYLEWLPFQSNLKHHQELWDLCQHAVPISSQLSAKRFIFSATRGIDKEDIDANTGIPLSLRSKSLFNSLPGYYSFANSISATGAAVDVFDLINEIKQYLGIEIDWEKVLKSLEPALDSIPNQAAMIWDR